MFTVATAEIVIDSTSKVIDRAFTYAIPNRFLPPDVTTKTLSKNFCESREAKFVEVGKAVLVDCRNKPAVGFVISVNLHQNATDLDFEVKEIKDVLSESYFERQRAEELIWIAHKYVSPLSSAVRLALPSGGTPHFVSHKDGTTSLVKASRRPKKIEFDKKDVDSIFNNYSEPEHLTSEQNHAINVIEQMRSLQNGSCVLLDGVTGSGKTEVYLQVISKVLSEGKNAIVLVPEISLTPQTVARFKSRFGDEIAVMHSKMTQAQRRQQWFWIKDGNARVVIGARSALFSPLKNVGIVVIDEEHETSYKQESAPRYHARTVAKKLMEEAGGVLVLGSATPSIEAIYCSKHNADWRRVELSARATGQSMPKVEIVNMTTLPKAGKYSLFSPHLKSSIFEELGKGHKVVLLLNQRGYSKFLLCRDCGFVPECPNCSTSLTYHEDGNKLKCHHCGYDVKSPAVCPACGSPYLKRLGAGTQKVEGELRLLLSKRPGFEDVLVVRMDADTTERANSHERLLRQFDDASRSVLLGTQMIAKGLDFDEVTLVGVINADTVMHVPDFRASERTFDLIEQVSGRCGRSTYEGRVIVQTYEPDNSALRAAKEHDRELFLRVELPKRKVLKFPPYVSLVRLLVWSTDKELALKDIDRLRERVVDELSEEEASGLIISPASACPFEKVQKSWHFHILLKVPLEMEISSKIEKVFRCFNASKGVSTAVDVDPISLV